VAGRVNSQKRNDNLTMRTSVNGAGGGGGHNYLNNNHSSHNNHLSQQPHYHGLLVGLVIAFIAGFALSYGEFLATSYKTLHSSVKYFVGDSKAVQQLSTLELLGDLSLARQKIEAELMGDYGEYYGLMFDKAAAEHVFIANPASKERLLRRLQLKILSAQRQKQSPSQKSKVKLSANAGSPTSASKASASKTITTTANIATTFTWVTSGDGAAAGHGNLFSQTYTAVMENTARDAFRRIGINFLARNYAMGGYVSAPEVAMCMESIYGTDIDIMMWDFNLMEQHADDNANSRALLWGHRASVHPTKPIVFAMDDVGGSRYHNVWLGLEQRNGMGVVVMDHLKGLTNLRQRAPDAVRGAGGKSRIPLPLKNYRCNGSFEAVIKCDDPMRYNLCYDIDNAQPCIDAKFKTKDACIDAKYQSSWHPGWKEHYLKGRLMGVFLVDMLQEALIDLDAIMLSHRQDRDTVYSSLIEKEAADVRLAVQAPPPPAAQAFSQFTETMQRITPQALYKQKAICHTALLPAQERYDGILMESGHQTTVEANDYDRGLNRYFMTEPVRDRKLPLAFDPNDRQRCEALEIDHKDFFWVRDGDGWLSRIVPNDSELLSYRDNSEERMSELTMHIRATASNGALSPQEPVQGLIMVCLKICPLKRCPDDAMGFGPLKRNTNQLSIKVDGIPVTSVHKLDDCHFLEGPNGLRWGPGKTQNGQYTLSFLINDKQKNNMKISSFIVM
jgi:hypothetical protein